jgi:hypothetical protein
MHFIRPLAIVIVVCLGVISNMAFAQEAESGLDNILGKNTNSAQSSAVLGFSYEQCKKIATENRSPQSSEEFKDNCDSFSDSIPLQPLNASESQGG